MSVFDIFSSSKLINSNKASVSYVIFYGLFLFDFALEFGIFFQQGEKMLMRYPGFKRSQA